MGTQSGLRIVLVILYQNDISKYFDANPEAINEMVKDNPVAAVKVFGEHILEENE